jgi:hypothetical protein
MAKEFTSLNEQQRGLDSLLTTLNPDMLSGGHQPDGAFND